MTTTAHPLAEAILAKCQRDRWYGPASFSPRRYDNVPVPDIELFFGDEEEHVSVLTIDSAQDYSSVPPNDPERIGFAFAKATAAQLTTSEQHLGFALPSVLRELYQNLANGGFGPGSGLRGVLGGYNGANHEGTILDFYPTLAKSDELFDVVLDHHEWLVLPEGRWPRHMLCLGDMGCVQEACVDAVSERLYLLVVTAEERHALVPLPWTLKKWLWRWVRGENVLGYPTTGAA